MTSTEILANCGVRNAQPGCSWDDGGVCPACAEAAIAAAVLAEREACAQEAEQQIALEIPGPNMKPVNWRDRIATAIRARGSG